CIKWRINHMQNRQPSKIREGPPRHHQAHRCYTSNRVKERTTRLPKVLVMSRGRRQVRTD
ncbi:hypothetical protein BKA93DRAFT_775153, partial [Sparassis latifolia]